MELNKPIILLEHEFRTPLKVVMVVFELVDLKSDRKRYAVIFLQPILRYPRNPDLEPIGFRNVSIHLYLMLKLYRSVHLPRYYP